MSDQAKTLYHQAQIASQSGNHDRAIELLRRARLLATNDPNLSSAILAEMVRVAPLTQYSSQEQTWAQQLSLLSPARPEQNVGEQKWLDSQRVSRFGRLAFVLVAGVAVTIIGGYYFKRFYGYSSQRYQALAIETTSQPAVTTQSTAVSATEKITGKRASQLTERERRLNEHIGLVVWVQEIVEEYSCPKGRFAVTTEVPLATGTAFAISHNGLMLTNRHVVNFDTSFVREFPVTLHGKPYLKICFASDPNAPIAASVKYVSKDYDVAVLESHHIFSNPFTLNFDPIAQQDEVLAVGYPASVNEIEKDFVKKSVPVAELIAALRGITVEELVQMFCADAENKSLRSVKEAMSDSAFNCIATGGIISSPYRTMNKVAYHLFDAGISGGNSGGPLFLRNKNEVIGIVTMGGVGPEAQGKNYALELSQLRTDKELAQYLP